MGNQLNKMKLYTLLLAFCAIQYVFTAQGTPAAASYCMGNTDNATTCSSCFNWGSGTIGARQLATGSCANAVANKVTDCKYYNGNITSTKTTGDRMMCNGKKWLNLTDSSTPASIVVACSDTAIDTTKCASEVANCSQSVCFKPKTGTNSVLCGQCKSGYKGSGT